MTLQLTDEEKNIVQKIKEENENYISTINAAISFISIITWNGRGISPDCNYSIGRTMLTTGMNRIHPNEEVTPDIVVETDQNIGYVVEIKKSLPNNEDFWNDVFSQICKYDDNLIGWWEPKEGNIENINVILLLHQSRVVRFINYLEKQLNDRNINFEKNFSIIGFNRSDEVQHYYFHQLRYGTIFPEQLKDRLIEGINVPIEKVFKTFPNLKFFDNEPPAIEYTMGILWQDIFNSMPRGEYDHSLKGNPIEVNTTDITRELQKLYGFRGDGEARNVDFPQKSWVIKAMDSFVKIGLAKKHNDESYIIIFRQIQHELIEYFGKSLFHKSNNPIATQPQLI